MKISKKKVILFLITLIFLYFIFINLDIKELIKEIKQCNIKILFLLVISIIVSLSFRGLCFKQLISKSTNIPLKESILLCLTSAALNIVLPARAGDIFRGIFVGGKYNVNKIKILGAILLERIFDVFIIFCFLFAGIFIYNKNQTAIYLCTIAGLIIFIGFIFVIIAHKYNKTDLICNYIIKITAKIPGSNFIEKTVKFINNTCNSLFNGFEIITNPKKIIIITFSAFCIWFFECVNFYIVTIAFGCNVHWSVTIFLIGFIAMACMIPSASIFIGPYQVAVISAFALYNINKETALAISVTEQAVVTIVTAIAAIIFFFTNNLSYKSIKKNIEENINNK